MLEKVNGACFMHICSLYIYIALREAKAKMVKKRGTRVGQFASKEKITSFPSTFPVPSFPSTSLVPSILMKWAVNRYVKLLHIACSSLVSVLKGTLE